MKHSILTLFLLSCLLTACSAQQKSEESSTSPSPPPLEAAEAEKLYALYCEGDYRAYVDAMESCDSMPESYRTQMMHLHKMHAHQQRAKQRSVRSAKVLRIEPSKTKEQANVLMRVDYANRTHETIQLSMVYDGKQWRLE